MKKRLTFKNFQYKSENSSQEREANLGKLNSNKAGKKDPRNEIHTNQTKLIKAKYKTKKN